MSQKKLKPKRKVGTDMSMLSMELQIAPEILETPDTYLVHPNDTGRRIYDQALKSLVARYQGQLNCAPDVAAGKVEEMIHALIAFLADAVPLDAFKRPVDGTELSAIFGAATGMAAAAAVDSGQATVAELENMTDGFYTASREALPRGILKVRAIDKAMGKKK